MDQMSYKERLEVLARAGFTAAEMKRLCRIRRTYRQSEQDQAPENLSRLYFIRWLVTHGKLNEECIEHSVSIRGETSHV